MEERLQKILSAHGVSSRRGAEGGLVPPRGGGRRRGRRLYTNDAGRREGQEDVITRGRVV